MAQFFSFRRSCETYYLHLCFIYKCTSLFVLLHLYRHITCKILGCFPLSFPGLRLYTTIIAVLYNTYVFFYHIILFKYTFFLFSNSLITTQSRCVLSVIKKFIPLKKLRLKADLSTGHVSGARSANVSWGKCDFFTLFI